MSRRRWRLLMVLVSVAAGTALAQDAPNPNKDLKPHQAVREGNRLLLGGNAKSALEHYQHAAITIPDARELAFDEGLARYALGEYEPARLAFEKAVTDPPDALSADALYGIGTSHHAEALKLTDPAQAIPKLESAMQAYQRALDAKPDHAAAKDAHFKAGAYWRQLKQLQQQQQQNPQQQQNQNDDQEQDSQPQASADSKNDQQNQNQQNAQQKQSSADKQEQQSQQKQAGAEKEQTEEKQANADQNEPEQNQQAQAAKEQDAQALTREQAQRQLREMVQALRERSKLRTEKVSTAPLPAGDKDW